MSKEVKLVAESLQDFDNQELNEKMQELNESSKGSLQKFLKNPEKMKQSLVNAYARQLGKTKGLKNVLLGMDTDKQVVLAKQSLKSLEDPTKGYAWLKIANGKIVGAGALGVKKSGTGSDLGQ